MAAPLATYGDSCRVSGPAKPAMPLRKPPPALSHTVDALGSRLLQSRSTPPAACQGQTSSNHRDTSTEADTGCTHRPARRFEAQTRIFSFVRRDSGLRWLHGCTQLFRAGRGFPRQALRENATSRAGPPTLWRAHGRGVSVPVAMQCTRLCSTCRDPVALPWLWLLRAAASH